MRAGLLRARHPWVAVMRRDTLGEFLKAYDEYLEGDRDYDDLPPRFPDGSRLASGWNPEDTWGKYAPDSFRAPPAPAPPVGGAAPEVVDLPAKPRRWWWPWGGKTIPTARVIRR